MSSNVALLHSNNCCVLEPAICEDLDLHVVIFLILQKLATLLREAVEMGYVDPRIIEQILEKPEQETSKDTMSEADNYGELTDGQIERLGSFIPSKNMESIAEGAMSIIFENIMDLKDKHRGNAKVFNRQIIRQWVQENQGTNQAQVFMFLLPPATKLRQGYVFTGVYDSVHRACTPPGHTRPWYVCPPRHARPMPPALCPPPCRRMVNARAIRILLECNLVVKQNLNFFLLFH